MTFTVLNYGLSVELNRQYGALSGFESLSMSFGHHQALAGGSSISQLQAPSVNHGTPPGFSRWFFNFTATSNAPEPRDTTRL